MATIGDTIDKASQEVESTILSSDDNAVINNVRLLIDEMRGVGTTGKQFWAYNEDELSRIAGSIGVLMPNLGDIIARLQRDFRVSNEVIEYRKSALRKPAKEHLINKKGVAKPTVDDIKGQVTLELFEDNLRLAFKEQKLEQTKHLWWAVRSVLGVIEQRIHVLQGERRGMRMAGDAGEDSFVMADPGLKRN